MKKTIKLAATLYLLCILAFIINIRLEFVPLTWISLGRFLFGEVGYADGLQILFILVVDFCVFAVFFLVLAAILRTIFQWLHSSGHN